MTVTREKVTRLRNEPMVPKHYLTLLNQIFEIERKVGGLEGGETIRRNIDRMKDVFLSEISADTRITYENPMGQSYDDTRNDLDAHIAGESTTNLVVVDVIKPIIRMSGKDKIFNEEISVIVQKGMVTVESKNTEKGENNE